MVPIFDDDRRPLGGRGDSGASRRLFYLKDMFQQYVVLKEVCVYTVSGEAIPVVGLGTVGDITNCLHVPTLEKAPIVSASYGR